MTTTSRTEIRQRKCPKCGFKIRDGRGYGPHVTWCGRTEENFWPKVKKTAGCWIWTGALCPNGYGRLSIGARSAYPHRYSYELANGPIPKGQWVLHRCDTPACVRPDHLFLGTDKDNSDDKYLKGRNQGKLTIEKAREIKRRFKRTDRYKSNARELAAEFGVTTDHVLHIIAGRCWARIAS